MKEELTKAKKVICNNCNIKNCATCSVTSIMMESRVNYLEKEVEELKTKLDSLLNFNKELITVKTEQQVVEKEQTTAKKNGKPKATAEILYRYISGNNDFVENHTGLEDVLIEKEIFVRCMKQHKKMKKSPWKE